MMNLIRIYIIKTLKFNCIESVTRLLIALVQYMSSSVIFPSERSFQYRRLRLRQPFSGCMGASVNSAAVDVSWNNFGDFASINSASLGYFRARSGSCLCSEIWRHKLQWLSSVHNKHGLYISTRYPRSSEPRLFWICIRRPADAPSSSARLFSLLLRCYLTFNKC